MKRTNKAHTTTANRIAKRYGANVNGDGEPDVSREGLTVEVETTATLNAGLNRLKNVDGPVFLAVTNREGLVDALKKAHGTRVGVMDPQGEIVKQSDPPLDDSNS